MKLLAFSTLSEIYRSSSPVSFTAPKVPDSGAEWMPAQTDQISQGFWELMGTVIGQIHPHLLQASGICLAILSVILLVRMMGVVSAEGSKCRKLICCVSLSLLFTQNANSLISLAAETVTELSEYGKLLIPVMTSALAAQGGVTVSAALYAGTLAFNSILTTLIGKVLVPLVYVFLTLSICAEAMEEELLRKLAGGIKWACTWSLKSILYIFTGCIGITGVVSGATDAAALKAAKLTISGVVPIVGGILSDASEAVLVSAGLAKNAAGIYGILAMLAVIVGPFLKIGAHYLMMRVTALLCSVFAEKNCAALVESFCSAMGLLLAMTGSVCVLLLISVVCFLRGVG